MGEACVSFGARRRVLRNHMRHSSLKCILLRVWMSVKVSCKEIIMFFCHSAIRVVGCG